MEQAKKKNLTFCFLQALAIVMVIDDHVDVRIGLLSSIFPYNSFYMPLFVFISGYFYKSQSIKDNVLHKFSKLMIPYLVWNIIGEVFDIVLAKCNIVHWEREFSASNVIMGFTAVPYARIVGAMWFVVMLFYVAISYNIIRRLIKQDSFGVNFLLQIFFSTIAIITLKLCINGYSANKYFAIIAREIFYIQFYHFGHWFKKYLEKSISNVSKTMICIICIAINVICILVFGDKINFYNTSTMRDINSCILPIITSVTGILFYYEVMTFLSSKIGFNKWINFISDNTYTIMAVHLFFVNIPNFYAYSKCLSGSVEYANFDADLFQKSVWVRYNNTSTLIGFFLGLLGSLAVACIIQVIKQIISKHLYKHTNVSS